MDEIFERMEKALKHLHVLHNVFVNEASFCGGEERDFRTYETYELNKDKLAEVLNALKFGSQLYDQRDRQMILADLFEYIFLGRGYYSMRSKKDKENFIRAILRFVNLLMCYDSMTVSSNLRKKFMEELGKKIAEVKDEEQYTKLKNLEKEKSVGFPKADAAKPLNDYFDSLLPKTAGGLWHELLVYVFLLHPHYSGVEELTKGR